MITYKQQSLYATLWRFLDHYLHEIFTYEIFRYDSRSFEMGYVFNLSDPTLLIVNPMSQICLNTGPSPSHAQSIV